MPIQHAIWKVGDNPQPLAASQLVSEQKLEEMIVRDPRILSSDSQTAAIWMRRFNNTSAVSWMRSGNGCNFSRKCLKENIFLSTLF